MPRLPDFIIGGAMKAGTTSLHHVLASHPDVVIPDPELFFFDCDDLVQHPWIVAPSSGAALPDYERDFEARMKRYGAWFSAVDEGVMAGEDTTTYLASERAPARIAELLPDAKLIFIIRDPVERAYSQYWHEVRAGQAFFDFETTLGRMPGTIIQRGLYQEQLERYLRHVPAQRMLVVVFEEFVRAPQLVVDGVCGFLDLRTPVEVASLHAHRNPGHGVRCPRAARWAGFVRAHWAPPVVSQGPRATDSPTAQRMQRLLERALFRKGAPNPVMNSGIRERLSALYRRANPELSELVGRDLRPLWPSLQG